MNYKISELAQQIIKYELSEEFDVFEKSSKRDIVYFVRSVANPILRDLNKPTLMIKGTPEKVIIISADEEEVSGR